jgi:hypothetical protein
MEENDSAPLQIKQESDLLVAVEASPHPGSLRKTVAMIATGTSVIAVMPVPYLVMRSVFYLATRQTDFTFQEMMDHGKVVFWIFGPTTALLATIAIAPFNMVNAYNTVINIKLTSEAMRCASLLQMISGIFLTFTGAVNAYNVNYAINDILRHHQTTKMALRYPCVSIGLLFAGISDARVFLLYVAKDTATDYRYLTRGTRHCYRKLQHHATFFASSNINSLVATKSRQIILNEIAEKLDDLKMILLLGLNDSEITQLKQLYENQQWITDFHSTQYESFTALLQRGFPLWRFLGSEVIGSLISGLMAYYGNQNTYEYTYKAVSELLSYCCLQSTNWLLRFVGGSIGAISFFTGFCISFFLIRDLFFRDVFKATTGPELLARIPLLLISLIPAFSFGLLNVILTVLNENLSPLNKTLVSCAAILGATVVTRFGIEGGISQLQGSPNIRRELADITNKLMKQFYLLPTEELDEINTHLTEISQRHSLQLADINDESATISYNPHQ